MMNKKTRMVVVIGMLTGLAVALQYALEVPIGALFGFPHLKMDFSDVPALVAAVLMGPLVGVLVEFLKNLLLLPKSSTFGIGDLINFVVGSGMILAFCYAAKGGMRLFGKKTVGYGIGLIAAMLATVALGALSNYLLFPVYFNMLGAPVDDALIMGAVVSSVSLNLVKSVLTILPVTPFIERLQKQYARQEYTMQNRNHMNGSEA